MPRIAWILLSAVAALLFVGLVGAAFVIASGSGSEADGSDTTLTLGEPRGQVELPLASDDQAFMLAQHKGRVLIGLAARPGGPVEVAALGGETPVSSEDLSFAVDGKPVTAASCGRAKTLLTMVAIMNLTYKHPSW